MVGAFSCTYETHTPMEKPNVYPIQTFLEIQRLMRKLNLTPADCLTILAESLSDLDRQIDEHEAEREATLHLPFPAPCYGLTAHPRRVSEG